MIVHVALPVAAWTTFDYWSPGGLAVQRGTIVRVPLSRRSMHGVVTRVSESSEVSADKLQPVAEVIESIPPLPEDVLAMADFVSRYYQQPLGLVVSQILPPLERSRRARNAVTAWRATPRGRDVLGGRAARLRPHVRDALAPLVAGEVLHRAVLASIPPAALATLRRWTAQGLVEASAPPGVETRTVADGPPLNDAQQVAAAAIASAHGFAPLLLQGVTGSGKTEVYLAAAARVIAGDGQVLVLVPEINLTPQLEQRVRAALPGRLIVTLHSRLAAGERHRGFAMAATGEADLVVGTRLAVFTPLPRLQLIVVDEEHDASFKQQDNVRYHGRDVAVWRAKARGVPIVLGSATPSLESLLHARNGRYGWLRLTHRAIAPARMPAVVLTPAHTLQTRDGLGASLIAAIGARLERGEQSLVFINRRGFAPSLLCGNCSWRAECPQCSARLVMHREVAGLRCHHCGHVERLTRACPHCGNVDLVPVGQGTQRLEDALRRLFPTARIARIDRDTTQRKGAFTAIREQMNAGALDILVGTQMLAKGHDFPRLTLVGVLGGDNALYSADFRATERFGALLFQVAGRAGRANLPGEVIVQTDFPHDALYQALMAHDYDRLADALLADRRTAGMPPYTHLTVLAAEAPTREMVNAFLERGSALGRAHARAMSVPVEVFAPVPAMLAKRAGMERGQVVVQSTERADLQRFLPGWRAQIDELPAHRLHWAIDVDPLGFL